MAAGGRQSSLRRHRVLGYELREDVSGAGEWRGGLGSVREFTFLSDGGASVEGEVHRYRPWGFLGSSEGMPAKLDVFGQWHAPSKVPHMNIVKYGRLVCYGRRVRQPTGARSGEGGG
jgi:N-methylhydantoinase B